MHAAFQYTDAAISSEWPLLLIRETQREMSMKEGEVRVAAVILFDVFRFCPRVKQVMSLFI